VKTEANVGSGVGNGIKTSTPCTMGVGCDEYGVCYAAAHGKPDECPRSPPQLRAVREVVS
jgi:hypothetical protein